MLRTSIAAAALLVLAATVAVPPDARGEEKPATTSCEMTFTLKGWSAGYKTAKGSGTVTCANGESARVTIKVTGGGLTVGKSEIREGKGKFSSVRKIEEVFGSYAAGEAHAGAVKSASAQVLTKGEVSLALSGTGAGFDLGIDAAKFTLKRAK